MGSQFQSKDQKGNKRWNRVVRIDKRSIKVIITGYAKKEFDKLNKIVGEEIKMELPKVITKFY